MRGLRRLRAGPRSCRPRVILSAPKCRSGARRFLPSRLRVGQFARTLRAHRFGRRTERPSRLRVTGAISLSRFGFAPYPSKSHRPLVGEVQLESEQREHVVWIPPDAVGQTVCGRCCLSSADRQTCGDRPSSSGVTGKEQIDARERKYGLGRPGCSGTACSTADPDTAAATTGSEAT
jgi:hypothetical protein